MFLSQTLQKKRNIFVLVHINLKTELFKNLSMMVEFH